MIILYIRWCKSWEMYNYVCVQDIVFITYCSYGITSFTVHAHNHTHTHTQSTHIHTTQPPQIAMSSSAPQRSWLTDSQGLDSSRTSPNQKRSNYTRHEIPRDTSYHSNLHSDTSNGRYTGNSNDDYWAMNCVIKFTFGLLRIIIEYQIDSKWLSHFTCIICNVVNKL